MKAFFASLLGTITGLLLFVVGGTVLFFIVLGVISAMSRQTVEVEPGSYLVFDLSANITDAPVQMDGSALLAALSGEPGTQILQLRLVTRALEAAATDDRIAGVVLTGSFEPVGYGTGFAALREVRGALERVRAAGKPVKAYLEYPTTRDFYVASVADEVVLDPYGVLVLAGLASEPTFMAGAFDRFGVGVQVSRVGKYKAAVEPFIRQDLSPENREQLQGLLDDLWVTMRDSIAASRGLTPADLQAIVDSGRGFQAASVLELGLVDRVAYRDEVLAELRVATGVTDDDETFRQVSLAHYIRQLGAARAGGTEVPAQPGGGRGRVAIVYAEGPIVDGEGTIGEVGGEKFAREIRELRRDEDVKAIVLRVNSPGGSASASEHIQRELRLAREVKPVVVSMGTYAASGGYWISTYADRIFAEPSTITGSIGVFGVFFNIKELGNDLGFTWDVVKTGRFADMMTISRPKTEAEMEVAQRVTDWIYDEFIGKVAESRNLPPTQVQEIAQGRVWSGRAALELGLVDEIGGLAQAVAYAAERADLGAEFRLVEFPRKKELAEALAEMLERFQPTTARAGLAQRLAREAENQLRVIDQFNDPRGVYARLPLELTVQ